MNDLVRKIFFSELYIWSVNVRKRTIKYLIKYCVLSSAKRKKLSVLNYVHYATEKRGKIVKRLSCESDERGPIRYIEPQEKLTDRIDE